MFAIVTCSDSRYLTKLRIVINIFSAWVNFSQHVEDCKAYGCRLPYVIFQIKRFM